MSKECKCTNCGCCEGGFKVGDLVVFRGMVRGFHRHATFVIVEDTNPKTVLLRNTYDGSMAIGKKSDLEKA